MDQLPPLSYVACHYDDHWWIGTIIEKCDGGGDIKVNFLHPFGPSKPFYWPAKQDHCWVPLDKLKLSTSLAVLACHHQQHDNIASQRTI